MEDDEEEEGEDDAPADEEDADEDDADEEDAPGEGEWRTLILATEGPFKPQWGMPGSPDLLLTL